MLWSVSISEIDWALAASAFAKAAAGKKKMAKIRIVKEKKSVDYTFIDSSLNLDDLAENKEARDPKKDDSTEPDYRLRGESKKHKARFKPKITGGHSMQGHSPVYE
jgi:hypothetical protein